MDAATITSLVVATIALAGVIVTAYLSRGHDRQQQARSVLVEPAENFARLSLNALAALRYVTPPELRAPPTRPHRNEPLLTGKEERERRLVATRVAIDEVRPTRAHVRLVFHPESTAAEMSRRVLEHLRACLESAEEFYAQHDDAAATGRLNAWQTETRQAARDLYKNNRKRAYDDLDAFFKEVSRRLVRPSWAPQNSPR